MTARHKLDRVAGTRDLPTKARRLSPEERRREILEAGAAIALTEGLGRVTARSVAETIGVRAGLVTHYFPTVDQLLAAIFNTLGAQGRLGFTVAAHADLTPLEYMRGLIAKYTRVERDPVSLMWLDAWRQAADRPLLRDAVVAQMETDAAELESLIERGVAAEEFSVIEPARAAMRIFGILDGQIVASVVRAASAASNLDYAVVVELAYEAVERELGLPQGSLAVSQERS